MNKFLTNIKYTKVLKKGFLTEDSDIQKKALYQLFKLVRNSNQTFELVDNQIFHKHSKEPSYYLSSPPGSFISMPEDLNKEYDNPLNKIMADMEEEYVAVSHFVKNVNKALYQYDDLWMNIIFERFFLNISMVNVMKKYSLTKRKYYEIIDCTDYLIKFELVFFSFDLKKFKKVLDNLNGKVLKSQ